MKKQLLFAIVSMMMTYGHCDEISKPIGDKVPEESHSINFSDVPVVEFIRYVSKICGVNFIFNHKELQFNVSLSSGKEVSSANILKALFKILKAHGFSVSRQEDYIVIHSASEAKEDDVPTKSSAAYQDLLIDGGDLRYEFFVHKLQYHDGSDIQDAIKKISVDLKLRGDVPSKIIAAIESIQWIRATNSLVYSGDKETEQVVRKLLNKLDAELKQVFIEVLVIETDLRKSLEFGLQWAAGGQFNNKLGFGMGNFPKNINPPPFASAMQGIDASNTPTGLGQIPLGSGFDLGVIGDIIMHKGRSYLSLGSLVSALQVDGDSTIVLNQKIITQDNKNSTIFVGDNIPFTGSVVQTVGQSQQTTANIEYRDIGVNLSITPRLGDGDIITLDLCQEISESLNNVNAPVSNQVNGIRTTKTNMMTHVHVPDKHFLVLSGMVRNAKGNHKAGLPCLGGLPFVGAAFSKTTEQNEKRNVMIFVRPHIIRSMEDYRALTKTQEHIFEEQSESNSLTDALEVFSKD